MESVELRPATQEDSTFAFEVKKAALGEYVRQAYGWDEAEQLRLHERRFQPSETRVILGSGEAVGLVTTRREGDRLRLRQLFLAPRVQGKGLGSQVLAQVLNEARESDRVVALRVLRANPRAKVFYERHGFAVVGQTDTHDLMEKP